MTQDEAERVYASRVNVSMTRAAEEALPDPFYICHKPAIAELENTSYHLVGSLLTEMAHDGALGKSTRWKHRTMDTVIGIHVHIC